MRKNIGIDIGGTKVLMGIMDENANILTSKQIPTLPEEDPRKMIYEIICAMNLMLNETGLDLNNIDFIGAGVPGTVDTNTGIVQYCPNIEWINVPAGQYFGELTGREVKICQDSRLAALGELLFGAGKGYHDLACITLGTGIGCGIIVHDTIFNGGMNTAGELGHIVIEPDGRPCPCGRKGCLERYSSGTGILLGAYEKFPDKLKAYSKAEDIFEMAYSGHEQAIKLIEDSVDKLAYGIATLVNLLSPQIIVFSGGMCVHEKLIIEPLKKKIHEKGYIAWTKKKELVIKKALLEDKAAMIGASVLYKGIY